jgi:hypothetical protein
MSFEEFQNRARLYVIGALEPDETVEFENARKEYAQQAEDFIAKCYDLHGAKFASLELRAFMDGMMGRSASSTTGFASSNNPRTARSPAEHDYGSNSCRINS